MDKQREHSLLIWIPRVLAIAFILFISLFALDSFSNEVPLFQSLLGFLMHLIPSLILLAILIISWKKPVIGGCVFIISGIALSIFWGTYKEISRFLILTFPLIVTGIMFIIWSHSLREGPN